MAFRTPVVYTLILMRGHCGSAMANVAASRRAQRSVSTNRDEKAAMGEFIFRSTSVAPDATKAYLALFRACFPTAKQYSPKYLAWQYVDNPDGPVVGTDAFAGDELAATYVCIPAKLLIRGHEKRALLSLNTATHPKYQGKGLFTKLASATYSRAADLGYDVVYGVANQNSIRGFSTKLGFQDVGGLAARIGVGAFPVFDEKVVQAAAFRRLWHSPGMKWRAANPANRLDVRSAGDDLAVVFGRTQYPGIRVQGLVAVDRSPQQNASEFQLARSGPPSLRLSIGLQPMGMGSAGLSVLLPDRLKPSPLRLIYRNLTDSRDRIDIETVLFSFVDFDAY